MDAMKMAGFAIASALLLLMLRQIKPEAGIACAVCAGALLLLMLLLVMTGVWLCDTVAYFFGKFAAGKGPFGRHLFAPSISPKKTWEGSVAGSVATIAWIAYWAKCSAALGCFNVDVDWAKAIGLGLLVTVAGQVGDLLMSALKRWSGTKDSGNLFVGHGGVLDRCDSFFLAAPALYLLMDFFQKIA